MKSIIITFIHSKTSVLLCLFFLSIVNNAYSKNMDLSHSISFYGTVGDTGSPQGNRQLEPTCDSHNVNPLTGVNETKVLKGRIEKGSIQSAESRIEGNTSSLTEIIPPTLVYHKPSFCKNLVDWVTKSQKEQSYLSERWPGGMLTKKQILWNKKGSSYTSLKFHSNMTKFHAARGFWENYSVPFQGLLHQPDEEYYFSLTKSLLTYVIKDQIQVNCEADPKTGKPVKPADGAAEDLGCKTGTRNGTTQVLLMGKPITMKYTVTCNHRTYQSSYFTIVYGDGTPVELDRDAHNIAVNSSGLGNDDYAVWRQTHDQTVKYNLDEIAKLNNISKKELVTLMILTPTWYMPILSDTSKLESFSEWGSIDLKHGENIDHAVLIHFLWEQFGITEEYLNDYVHNLEKQRKDSIISVVSPYILSAKPLLDIAETNIHVDDQKGLDSYKKGLGTLSEAFTVCQNEDLTELADNIMNILDSYYTSHLYYALKYQARTPKSTYDLVSILNRKFDLVSTLNRINDNPPKEGAIAFLSECRDYAFSNGNYDEALTIANYLRPMLLNRSEETNEQVIFDNYFQTICALLKKDKYSEAHDVANEYIGNTPNSILPYENLCYVYAYQRDKKSAMKIWKDYLLKSDKKYAKNHPSSPVCILLEERGWIKIK